MTALICILSKVEKQPVLTFIAIISSTNEANCTFWTVSSIRLTRLHVIGTGPSVLAQCITASDNSQTKEINKEK